MEETVGTRLTVEAHLTQLAAAAERFAAILAEGDLAADVPSCPGWRLADLGDHLGGIHQWGRHAVLAGTPDGVPTLAPRDRDGLVGWYRNCAGSLLAALRATPPDAPAWTFGPHPRTASFWSRRQAHETTMHLWDATAAQGAPVQLDDEMARDGLDEVVAMFFPRQVRLGRTPALARSLALAADGGHRWVLAGDGTGPPSAPEAAAEATVSGPAHALLLLLWRRIGLDGDPRLALRGDPAAVAAVLTAGLTP